MHRRPTRREVNIGPQGNRVVAVYEKAEETEGSKITQEVQSVISEMIMLAHKRGRVKKEKEDTRYAA